MFKKLQFNFTKYNRIKDIDIYLPDDYKTSKKRYPVLYINDGQNAFFDDKSYIGVSWGFSDYAIKNKLDVIMVAIPCVFDDKGRMDEYSPWVINHPVIEKELHQNINVGGEGDDYISWIINELKPYIDSYYPTLKNETYMIGSSMGGIITAYACLNYPHIFNKGAAISTPYFLTITSFTSITKNKDYSSLSFYFDCGDDEGNGDKTMSKMYETSNAFMYGYLSSKIQNLKYKHFKDASHNEMQWRKRRPYYMEFLFGGENV